MPWFETNYSDGGNLIAAVAHRPVTDPHFENAMFYQRELEAWRRRTLVDYIYVSSEVSPAYRRTYTAEGLDTDPAVELAFRAGEARVYRMKRPRPITSGPTMDEMSSQANKRRLAVYREIESLENVLANLAPTSTGSDVLEIILPKHT
jgi:hypothetical protein